MKEPATGVYPKHGNATAKRTARTETTKALPFADVRQFKTPLLSLISHQLYLFVGPMCASGFFMCEEGLCIENGWVCDGQGDCQNGEDEDPSICGRTWKF